MTPQEAIDALKGAKTPMFGNNRIVIMTGDDYRALLALLEWLRWRRVADEKPPEYQAVLVTRNGYTWTPFRHGDEWRCDSGHKTTVLVSDRWLPLPAPPTE